MLVERIAPVDHKLRFVYAVIAVVRRITASAPGVVAVTDCVKEPLLVDMGSHEPR